MNRKDIVLTIKSMSDIDILKEKKIKYINISLNILEKYSIELQKNKTSVLANTITDCYKQLSNKKTLIQRVDMDSETLDIKYIS